MPRDEIQDLLKEFGEMKNALEEADFRLQKKSAEVDAVNQQLKAANQQLAAANQQLVASQRSLKEKITELEKMNKLMTGRELKMVELKEEIGRLKQQLDITVETAKET